MKTILFLLGLTATALLLGACATPSASTITLPGTKWELVASVVLHPFKAHRLPCSLVKTTWLAAMPAATPTLGNTR